MKIEWEVVDNDHAGHLYCAKVDGGYLYKQVMNAPTYMNDGRIEYDMDWTASICFAPDTPRPTGHLMPYDPL